MTEHEIFQRLRADHAAVLAEIADTEQVLYAARAGASPSADLPADALQRVREFASHLARDFVTHLPAEDEVLYPALAERLPNGRALIAPLHDEHDDLRTMLKALQLLLAAPAGPARDEQIVIQVHDLADMIRIHIRKEEALVFAVAEHTLGPRDLAALDARRAPRDGGSSGPDRSTSPKGSS
jgi:hemerythrin-like domain-containing protein